MKTIILSVGVGAPRYIKSANRLKQTLEAVGYTGDVKIWTGEYPQGSEPHEQLPYAFKAHALMWAYLEGYDLALWIDTNVFAQHNPQPLFDHIAKHGYLIFLNGWSTGEWSTDEQLQAFRYTRDDAMQIPHAMANVIGINYRDENGQQLLGMYYHNRRLFKGAWSNANGEVSSDARVLGSRHDQSVLSLIAHANGYEFTPPSGWVSYDQSDREAVLISAGM